MKAYPFSRGATFLSLFLASAVVASASNVVVSNLATAASSGALLTDASGAPLPSGSMVRLGTFPGLDVTAIVALAQQGPGALLAGLDGFGPAFVVGAGAGSAAGHVEITANQAVASSISGLHAVILNAPTVEAATEVMVLRLADSVPADDASSLPGYLAIHLRDAEVVFGTRGSAGIATQSASVPATGFGAWILAQLGDESSPADRAAEADADGDGLANLLEYALGSSAGDGSSRVRVEIREQGGEYFVLSLRRLQDPALEFVCEVQADLSSSNWPELDSPLAQAFNPPSIAPEGYQWMEQKLPSGSRSFVRVKVTTGETP
jgi:hypothetical protein